MQTESLVHYTHILSDGVAAVGAAAAAAGHGKNDSMDGRKM